VLGGFGLTPYNYVVCVGRLMVDKAQHELVESFIRLKKRLGPDGVHADLKLVFVGEAAVGDDYAEILREQVVGRTDIIFTGVQTGSVLKTLMRFARTAAQPSYSEGMPLAVLEIAAFGVPLVLSDIPAHREIFGEIHGYNPVGDLDRLSRDLERNILHYETVRPVALAQARRIQDHYRWEVIAARYHVALVSSQPVSLEGQGLLRRARAVA
jgi:glycosyltransferase involved in cell wall biosynthesis